MYGNVNVVLLVVMNKKEGRKPLSLLPFFMRKNVEFDTIHGFRLLVRAIVFEQAMWVQMGAVVGLSFFHSHPSSTN